MALQPVILIFHCFQLFLVPFRTATIYPAAINTQLLDQITDQDVAEKMTQLYEQYGISPDRVANVVAFAIDQPEDTNVNEFTIGPTTQPW